MNTPAPKITDPFHEHDVLWGLIKDIRFAMFATRHSNGHIHARPMTTQNAGSNQDASLWFFMPRDAETVTDLLADPAVNVIYADPGKDSYVSVAGKAALVEDEARKRALWSKATEAWFPAGVADPNLALVQVKIDHANYWSVKDSKLVQLFHQAKAAVTGKPPTGLGEHAELRMR